MRDVFIIYRVFVDGSSGLHVVGELIIARCFQLLCILVLASAIMTDSEPFQ